MKRVSIAFRMTIGLVMMTISSILIANVLGIIPEIHELSLRRKISLCESLAINCSMMAQRDDGRGVAANLRLLAERNSDVVSAALRRRNGKIVYQIGEHESHWRGTDNTPDERASKVPRQSTEDNIFVPIMDGDREWGTLEVAFGDPADQGWLARYGLARYPILTLVGLCGLLNGIGIYWYLRRTLTYLDPSQAVPERVRTALDTLAEGLVVLDNEQRIVLANQSFAKKVGQQPNDLQGIRVDHLSWSQDLSDEDRPWHLSANRRAPEIGAKVGLHTKSEGERIFLVNASPIVDEGGDHRGVLASFDDITVLESKKAELQTMLDELRTSREEIKQRNHELQLLATRDALTGCLNRRTFFETFEKLWATAQRYGQPFSCVMLDIDFFKSINDNHGHATGDEVLRKVAQALQKTCRESDVVCRYGGEEFCILLPQLGIDQCTAAAERFRLAVQSADFSIKHLEVTASLGASSIQFGASDPREMLDQADKALYVAKRSGRNKVCRWDLVIQDVSMQEKPDPDRAHDSVERGDSSIPYAAVASLLSALSFRDPDTAAHCTRVAELSVATARGLMSVKDAYILEIAALLHDIGKIGVPDKILLKPGPLTAEEWRIMKIHDRIGVEIVDSSFSNQKLAAIVRYHHATYGKDPAHPEMPYGDEIPMGARIVTIADAYDAMVSDRVYRKGCEPALAFAELRRCAGTQFDPRLVERFIAIAEDYRTEQRLHVGSKQTALQLGLQIEQLASAMDQQDIGGIHALATRLEATAAKNRVPEVQRLAGELGKCAAGEPDLHALVSMTRDLLDLCRSAQIAYIETIPESVEANVARRSGVALESAKAGA